MDRLPGKLVRVAVLAVGVMGLMALPTMVNAAALYRLPYPAGVSSIVTNAPGVGGHTGMQRYATDFAMPAGTTIAASRSGRVKYVKEDSNVCGCNSRYGNSANYVVVDHGDGTQALYLHLQYNGALVRVGDRVEQGQPIGRSGMTGWTCGSAAGGCGPHLHFQVERTGTWFTSSLPSGFAEITDNDGVPLPGRTYVSENTAPPPPPGSKTCTGAECNGEDAAEYTCSVDARTVSSQDVTFDNGDGATTVRVEVRWSDTCQTNWARAQVVTTPAGAPYMTLTVQLKDAAGQPLPGTLATGSSANVYGTMWYAPSQPVKACIEVSGRYEASFCTKPV